MLNKLKLAFGKLRTSRTEKYPAVSCFMPTYARVGLIEEAIKSFLDQDYPGKKELVILNDFRGQDLHIDHPEIKVINLTSGKVEPLGVKRNLVIAACEHDYLFPWDDDDISLPNRISLSMEKIGNGVFWKPKGCFYSNYGFIDGPRGKFAHAQSVIHRSLFDAVGEYDACDVGEDFKFESDGKKSIVMEDIDIRDHYYICRWRGTGSPHISDENQTIKDPLIVQPTGKVELIPHYKQDYKAKIDEYVNFSISYDYSLSSDKEGEVRVKFCSGNLDVFWKRKFPYFKETGVRWVGMDEEADFHISVNGHQGVGLHPDKRKNICWFLEPRMHITTSVDYLNDNFGAIIIHDPKIANGYNGQIFEHSTMMHHYFDIEIKTLLANSFQLRDKSRLCSIIASGPGAETKEESLYDFRVAVVNEIDRRGIGDIDVYGKRWEDKKRQIENKLFAIDKYAFSICIENCIEPGYVTEKLHDVILAGATPLYIGHSETAKAIHGDQVRCYNGPINPSDFIDWVIGELNTQRQSRFNPNGYTIASNPFRQISSMVKQLVKKL